MSGPLQRGDATERTAFERILVANRGEIALRVMRTAKRMGYRTIAVFSDADRDAPHVRFADVGWRIGPATPRDSYLNVDAILAAALATKADAVHPGYGFLSESAAFAERCIDAGLTFVGPSPQTMRLLGNKAAAKRLLSGHGVPMLPGYDGDDQSDEAFLAQARALGLPLMIKAAAGGGGRGMRLVVTEAEFAAALATARSEARAAFGNGDLLLERALAAPRHVEVQIFGDRHGNLVHLGERDCSIQRRHQKLIEESPSPAVDAGLRERLGRAAIAVARACAYVGAGTVEFLLDAESAFYFIEVNARLQVEHPVTEAVTGLDLVEWQLRVARGEALPRTQREIRLDGHAIEARLCAEDPVHGFLPQSGIVRFWKAPRGARVEHALASGAEIPPYYDSMVAKVIAHADTRDGARQTLARALDDCVLLGVPTNKALLSTALRSAAFTEGRVTTDFLREAIPSSALDSGPDERVFALAAALLYARSSSRGVYGPWASWSTTALPPSTFLLTAEGKDDSAQLQISALPALDLRVTAGERTHTVRIAAQLEAARGFTRCELDGAALAIPFVFSGTSLYLALDGGSYGLRDVTAEPPATRSTAASDGLLRSPMSARVLSVLVGPQARVAAGDPVVVLESMKMEHALSLPRDATIRSIGVAVGAQVSAGDVLLEYDAATT